MNIEPKGDETMRVSWSELWISQDARDWMLEHRIPVTPEKVASFVRERLTRKGQLLPDAPIAEITTAVDALMTAHNIKRGIATMETERRYAVPGKYWEPAKNFDLEAPLPSEVPTSRAEADALERQRSELIAAMPSLDRGERAKAEGRVNALEDLLRRFRKLDEIERARG